MNAVKTITFNTCKLMLKNTLRNPALRAKIPFRQRTQLQARRECNRHFIHFVFYGIVLGILSPTTLYAYVTDPTVTVSPEDVLSAGHRLADAPALPGSQAGDNGMANAANVTPAVISSDNAVITSEPAFNTEKTPTGTTTTSKEGALAAGVQLPATTPDDQSVGLPTIVVLGAFTFVALVAIGRRHEVISSRPSSYPESQQRDSTLRPKQSKTMGSVVQGSKWQEATSE